MSDLSTDCSFQLPCPQCATLLQVPMSPEGGTTACPQCDAPVVLPAIIGWPPTAPAPLPEGQRRHLRVRTPAMPGSRIGQAASKQPPRIPKPGEIPAAMAASTVPRPSLVVLPVSVAPPVGMPFPAVVPTPLPTHPSQAPVPAPAAGGVPAVFLTPVPRSVENPFSPVPEAWLPPVPLPPAPLPPAGSNRSSLRQKSGLLHRLRLILPVAGAAFVCSAAVAAWRVWPSSLHFVDLVEPDAELLFHYQANPSIPQSPSTAQSPDLFEEFSGEGFHFAPPADYWERTTGAASPFALLKPAFTLTRSESSPPSPFGVGACDFSISTALLPPGAGVDETWQTLPSVLAIQARFSCGLPERYEIATAAAQPQHYLRLIWNMLPGGGGETARHLEMWVCQRGRVAWSMTGLMPGSTSSYALTRTMQRLANGFALLPLEPEALGLSLEGRDMQGASPLHAVPAPQPLYRWKTLPAGMTSWPGGRLLAPGADAGWALGPARLALASLPPDGLQKVSPSQLLTALRQIWPVLRGVSLPAIDPADIHSGKTLQLKLPATLEGAPAECLLHFRPSSQGTVIALALQPGAGEADAPDLAAWLENLDLTPAPAQEVPRPPAALQLPLLQTLAIEAHADGRPREAADFHLALFNRSQRLEDLASACSSLSSAGQVDAATKLFDAGGERFANTPGWELYRTLVLARLGAGARAHRHAMDLLAAQRFPGSLAAPYLDALIESRSWPQARAFASMLVRTDPDSAVWRLHYASIIAETDDRPKAIAIIHATQQTWPDDAMLGIECVQSLIRLKALQDAAAVAARVALAHPSHEQAQLILGQCHTLLGRTAEARTAYQRALKAAPSSQIARTALTSLAAASAQSDTAFVSPAIDPVPLPAALMNGLPSVPAETHAPALVLSRITGLRFQRGRLPATTVRSRILITNAEGMSQWNTLTLPLDPSRERLCLHALNVLNASGKIIARASPDDRYTLDGPDGGKLIHFPIQGLVPGCIIDYAVTRESLVPANTWPFIRHPFALSDPCLADICYVTGDIANLTWRHSRQQEPLHSGEALIWQEKQPPLLTQAPPPILYLGTVSGTWESVGRLYLEQIRHRLAPDAALKTVAASFTGDLPDRASKIAALARRVRSDISYTAIEFGYRAIIPQPAAVTLHNRFGDCKDHAVLLHGLLEAAGIPSYLALIHSSTPLHPDFPALSQFDHMIVAVPAGKDRFDFIDPTDKFLEPVPGTAPLGLAGRQALILDPTRPHLASTPDAMAPSTGTLQRLVTVEDGKSVHITDQLSLSGPAAATLRAQLATVAPGEQLPTLRRLLGLDRLREQLLEVSFTALRDSSLPLKARLVWQSGNTLQSSPQGIQLALSTPLEDYLLFPASLTDQASTGTISLSSPIQLHTTITIQPPAGFSVQAPRPEPRQGSSSFGKWECLTKGATMTWSGRLFSGRWTGEQATAGARFPAEALLPLRQPWLLVPDPFVSNQPGQ